MKELVAVLHNVRSLHNVGSIFRTADAAGVSKIYLCGITPKPVDVFGKYRSQISKVALGAEKTVPWEYSRSTIWTISRLKKNGYRVFSVEQSEKSVPYYEAKIGKKDKIALVVGNEIKGLPPSILRASDKILEIPMYGKKESLNVSVSFGIAVFGIII